ncbi:Type IV inositol polyphosphate 5-phosphatase 11, partial [Cucurbita argyrosperma subsp. argyrosperma]
MRPLNHLLRLCTGTNSKTPAPALLQHQGGAAHEGIKTVLVDEDVCSGVCIYIVTWNMNGQARYGDLEKLVGGKGGSREFELVVVGLQEVPRSDVSRLLQSALAESHMLVGEATMQSLQLYVFCSKNSDFFIKEVKVDKQSIGGCGGLLRRKKGAVAIFLNYRGIRMLFISCHLSEAERGRIFDGYCEGTLSFKPTYKYNVGSSKYDSSYKVRVPSWTDRILFKLDELEKISANLCSYDSMDEIYSSDHKPVKAQLCLRLTNTSSS